MSTAANEPVSECLIVPSEGAPARLAELGLTVELLSTSVAVGDTRRKGKVTAHYPRNYPSIVAWAETLAELRRQLIKLQDGWDKNNFANYETVFHLERGVSIAVAGGNKYTGVVGEQHPKLARRRGPMTTDRVRKNNIAGQFAFDLGPQFEPPESRRKKPADLGCKTWFLVVFADKDEVRIELSLASGLDREGVVASWIERILLPPLPVTGAVLPIDPHQDDDDDDEVAFVTRA